ncbi:hypothetical protein V6N12_048189 [Hibiscus sabdariffa]|uniref:Polygalacturonase n=1 Tax=Hibiscus sabdariffa TaxID=183260 RepID=A0ABR2EGK3_9ROSI
MFLVAFLVWSSSIETCIARRGKHWRQRRHAAAASLYKKKTKDHGQGQGHHNYHNGGSKPHKTTPPPSPKPKVNVPSTPPPQKGYGNGQQSKVLDVLHFGAKGDGKTDDTKAFQAAWAAACKVEASTVVVPASYVFLVGPISFSGPYCQANIVFQLDGTIIAPTDSQPWGKGLLQWLEFTKLKGITVQGKGIIDGRGTGWWQDAQFEDPYDDEKKLIIPLNSTVQERPPMPVRNELSGKMPSIRPTALRFYGSFNVTVTGITIQNSPQCHLKFDNCIGVVVHDMSISSPGDSPNTDGIHLQNSKDVLIHGTNLACDNKQLLAFNFKSNLQGGSGNVQGVLFSNIQVSEVQLPIVIDQFYCDKRTCKNQTAAVSLSGITYERIRGTYTVKPVHLACSDSLPCIGVTLSGIQLKPLQERYHLYDPFCWQTFGELTTPTVPPIGCLQIGKPSNNRVQSAYDVCQV